ncbi:hypothetical protein F511_43517 [Dorcoceras hygrometricum]|uniref:Uncharacterized protein n=1 Tax=Dorcoceras hygrometricum TaxID=472368 RepID=A0A2Z7BFD2_9LAMI|nr:hypothetical protein F511_43517 [Dorcoceras hygrometricum]
MCTRLESTNPEESSDDEAHNRYQAGNQHALGVPITNVDIRDVTQADSNHDQAGGEHVHDDEPNITSNLTTSGIPVDTAGMHGEQHESSTSYRVGFRRNKNLFTRDGHR